MRGRLRAAGRVRAYIHNLEGEQVMAGDWQPVLAEDPFTIGLNPGELASGMYFCRLVADIVGAGEDVSVVPFAVEH